MGHVIRPPSRSGDSTDGGLLSLVEQEKYVKPNNSSVVGISNLHNQNIINKSSHGGLHIKIDNSQVDNLKHDALADMIVSLSNGVNNSNNSCSSAYAWQVSINIFFFIKHLLYCLSN